MSIKKLLEHRFLLTQVVVLTVALTWVSLAKFVNPIGIEVQGSDKIGHFIAYTVFCVVWFLFLFFSEKLNKDFKTSLIIASAIAIMYGVLMELMQAYLTTYRSPEGYDIVANTSGTVFAVIILMICKGSLMKLKQN